MVTMKKMRDGRTMSYTAKKLGISVQMYSNYESGKTKIPADIFLRFCRYFDTSPYAVIIPYIGGDKNDI